MELADDQFMYKILDRVYPVGQLFWIQDDDRDPSIIFGFGVWERKEEVFILAAGSTHADGATGGADTHSHTLSSNGWARIGGSTASNDMALDFISVASYSTTNKITGITHTSTASNRTSAAKLGGSTDAKNTLPPYEAAYCWKRIA